MVEAATAVSVSDNWMEILEANKSRNVDYFDFIITKVLDFI